MSCMRFKYVCRGVQCLRPPSPPTMSDWRNGPAKYWYDLIGLPQDCHHFDYGLEMASNCVSHHMQMKASDDGNGRIDSDDAFVMVSQIHWERDVIWEPELVRQKVLKEAEKPSIAGWLPIDDKRTAPEFIRRMDDNDNNGNKNSDICVMNSKTKTPINGIAKRSLASLRKRKANQQLSHNTIDDNNDSCVKVRKMDVKWRSTLPEENRELALGLWEEEVIWDTKRMIKRLEPKIIPFSGDDDNVIIGSELRLDDNSNDSGVQLSDGFRDLSLNYNISNDEFYASVIKADNIGSTHGVLITHSIPATDLNELCFPTCVQDIERPLLKRSKILVSKEAQNVLLCKNKSQIDANISESDPQNSNLLTDYCVRHLGHLSAINGDIVLMEYSEEDPPLVMRVGMGSQIINYFKKTKSKSISSVEHKYAQTKCISDSPFIGDIAPGERQLSLENNMFRSPLFEHNCPDTDFLVIVRNKKFYIRELDGLFVVGQQLPLMEVPRPRSKPYYDFLRQFTKMFIYRCFDGKKYAYNLDTQLKNAFPNLSTHSLIKIQRLFTEKQTDRFRLKSNIPFEDQLNTLLTPEDCCTYYSTSIAIHRLRQSGYGDRLFLNIDDKDCDSKVDELVPWAPWNTTDAYIRSLNNKKWLNLSDMNSDGSLVFSNHSYKEFKDRMPTIKRCKLFSAQTIKRMSLAKCQEWLIDYGMAKDKVKKVKNTFECRDLVNHLSDKLRQSGVTVGMNVTKTTEQHYRLECQKLFDLHTSYYSSEQNYSTDEEEDEEEDDSSEDNSDLEEMGNALEAMLFDGKSLEQIEYEREEEIRKKWINSMNGVKDPALNCTEKEKRESFKGKVLKIIRTFEEKGKRYERVETIRDHRVIGPYVRIRKTKPESFIRGLSFVRNVAESGKVSTKSKSKSKSNTVPQKPLNGVSKTIVEKVCDNKVNGFSSINIDDDEWDISEGPSTSSGDRLPDMPTVDTEALVSVDGSKLKFSKRVVEEAKGIEEQEQKRLKQEVEEVRIDYYTPRTSRRCRVDPMVKLQDIFDKIIVAAKKLPQLDDCIEFFIEPVKEKKYPDYYEIIKKPMSLVEIRSKVQWEKYGHRQAFLDDIELIYKNSVEYNGSDHNVTQSAHLLLKFCAESLQERDTELTEWEEKYKKDGNFYSILD